MSKAAELAKAGETLTNQPSGRKNMVINGAMNVAQRATSVTGLGASAGYFTVDRWKLDFAATAGRLTMSQTADGPNGISANCVKLDCTTADTSIAAGEYLMFETRFEGQNLQRIGKGKVGAQQITFSFYVKANAAFTFGIELFDNDNTRQITKLFDTTADWVRHEITFPADVDDGSSPFDDDNARSLLATFWLHGGSTFTGGTLNTASWANVTNANRAAGIDSFFSNTDNNFFITGVQMEVGPVATEFEQEDISNTIAKCQRYFQILAKHGSGSGGGVATVGMAAMYNSGYMTCPLTFPVQMRTFGTMTSGSGTGIFKFYRNNGNDAFDDFVTGSARTANNLELANATDMSGTAGHAGFIETVSAAAVVTIDAEL